MNRVMQTAAYAHPTTPASKLYEMARSIDANVTVRTAIGVSTRTVSRETQVFMPASRNAEVGDIT